MTDTTPSSEQRKSSFQIGLRNSINQTSGLGSHRNTTTMSSYEDNANSNSEESSDPEDSSLILSLNDIPDTMVGWRNSKHPMRDRSMSSVMMVLARPKKTVVDDLDESVRELGKVVQSTASIINTVKFSVLIESSVEKLKAVLRMLNENLQIPDETSTLRLLVSYSKIILKMVNDRTLSISEDKISSAIKFVDNIKKDFIILQEDDIALMEGEVEQWRCENVIHQNNELSETQPGLLIVTNFQILYLASKSYNSFSIPIAAIQSRTKGKDKSKLTLELKDTRVIKFSIGSGSRKPLLSLLKKFEKGMPNTFFCFSHLYPGDMDGWNIFNLEEEYKRFGLPDEYWTISECNDHWDVCNSYPRVMGIPTQFDINLLSGVAEFRSKGRIPILSYRHRNYATLSRCSQPQVGMNKSSSTEDIAMLYSIWRASPSPKDFLPVLDARGKAAAMGNKAIGGGYEHQAFYQFVELEFCDIQNIHQVRASFNGITEILNSDMEHCKFYEGISASNWIYHQRKIISASIKVVDLLERGYSVLVHCSDGWDRTAQMCGLAQILIDPYYRTIEGLIAIIEKEFLLFGHQFSTRTGFNGKGSSERAPIFHQFIECLWQIQEQFPTNFEYNEKLLVFILDSLYNCRFGTFLYDNQKERTQDSIHIRSPSLWTYVLMNREEFVNIFYEEAVGRLNCTGSEMKLKFWEEYYYRWNPELRSLSRLQVALRAIEEKDLLLSKYEKEIESLKAQLQNQ
eukprot:TRINITY_DN3372_c0_g1_i1.p1 TRINITY_DN3372_c0_g1~~TRINITY_DN3372_c0_g1_i1.p1  ORF type:complete len:739 (-),score=151.21 TRINITY_DN3372_c0_g1_i1:4-2220(-)